MRDGFILRPPSTRIALRFRAYTTHVYVLVQGAICTLERGVLVECQIALCKLKFQIPSSVSVQ